MTAMGDLKVRKLSSGGKPNAKKIVMSSLRALTHKDILPLHTTLPHRSPYIHLILVHLRGIDVPLGERGLVNCSV